MTDPSPADVGIVTVSYDSGESLRSFLASVASTSTPAQIVVVENHPSPRHTAALARDAGARYVARPDNPGYGAAVNSGVAALDPSVRWILVANPDVVLHPDAVSRLVARAEGAADIAAVGPAIITDGHVYPSARPQPSLGLGIGHALFADVWKSNPWTARYHAHASDPDLGVGWLSGACLLLRRTAFEQIGGFDESYFMYFEDVDIGRRIIAEGMRSIYLPEAVVEHVGGHAADPASPAMIAAHHASADHFLSRRYPQWYLAPLRGALRAGLRIRGRLVRRAAARAAAR